MHRHGEPVQLPGKDLYFLNWKYIRNGSITYECDTEIHDGTDPMAARLYAGDGQTPARFREHMIPRGIRLETQPASLLPFEQDFLMHDPTILFDQGKYRVWYATVPENNADWIHQRVGTSPYNEFLAYAESADGFHWERPSLGLLESNGSTDNNGILRNPHKNSGLGWGSVFLDPTSETERYKMLYLSEVTEAQWKEFDRRYPGEINPMAQKGFRGRVIRHGVFGAVSPDGIHWKFLPEPLLIDHCDTLNTCCYDAERGQYVAYVRSWTVPPADENHGGNSTWFNVGKRGVARCFSRDFRHFSRPEVFLDTGADMAPTHYWYTTCKTHIPDQPGEGLLFPWRWEMEHDRGACFLFSSPDGLTWSRIPGSPAVQAGPPGSPEGGYVHCSPGLLNLPGGRWGLPYMGWPIPHKYPGRNYQGRHGLFPHVPERAGYAIWPEGRLTALVAEEDGEFHTASFYPPGTRLALNAVIPAAGSIRVAVLTRDEQKGWLPVKGFSIADCNPITGDALALPVSWNGRPELPTCQGPVVLQVLLHKAKLHSLRFQ